MANIRKSFNFRTGLQVDNDNFVVNANGLVGIGTSIPQNYLLNVHGDTRVTGLVTTATLHAAVGTVTVLNATDANVSGALTVSSLKVGSSNLVTNLIGYGYTAWITNDGGVGLHTVSRIGIGTNATPTEQLKVFGDVAITTSLAVGSATTIASYGINAPSGIVTASSFVGVGSELTNLNASNVGLGTLSNSRLPQNINVSGVVTATSFVGSLTGTATSLTGTPDITVGVVSATNITASNINATGIITASKVVADSIEVPNTGITTVSQLLHVGTGGTAFAALSSGRIGVGTAEPTSELQIRKSADVLAEIISDTGQSQVSIGQSVGVGNSTGVLRFGNSAKTFDVINRDTGNLNMILHGGGSGIDTGRFDWIYGQTNAELMSLTYDGKLGIGITNPDTNLHVVGTSTVTGNAWFGGNVTIAGTLNTGNLTLPSIINSNISVNTGVSTISVVNATNIGINSTSPAAEIDAQGSDALFGRIAIGTLPFTDTEVLKVDGLILVDSIGIGTTAMNTSGTFGHLQIYDKSIEFNGGLLNIKDDCQVGFNTFSPRSVFDFGAVGSATTNPYMIMPTITTSTRIGLGQTVEGAIIFNTTTKRFQGYTGTDWVDLH